MNEETTLGVIKRDIVFGRQLASEAYGTLYSIEVEYKDLYGIYTATININGQLFPYQFHKITSGINPFTYMGTQVVVSHVQSEIGGIWSMRSLTDGVTLLRLDVA